ncbi:hypothetical protein BCR41DRAFT_347972 [Lobosporangium transversale]|uniref:Uncharacterized protein n=1 Tax=Lobosporangium transversale TaxID=64571 RepID=A0A1Y2GYD9_9FUNG|nr:hypothetical protein BCR41DRAFT_347972 [Lobosporangium transversale]ORZ26824.1 hypothetical protein BCR41DRAFT_347972 [Lobosporangium transversale]|eukprot:XP_021884587.1 hypothetical protein BCR41DRAFT_347972 [Lobosporangium transversale]
MVSSAALFTSTYFSTSTTTATFGVAARRKPRVPLLFQYPSRETKESKHDALIIQMINNGHSWADIEAVAGDTAFDRYYSVLDPVLKNLWTPNAIERLNTVVRDHAAELLEEAASEAIRIGTKAAKAKVKAAALPLLTSTTTDSSPSFSIEDDTNADTNIDTNIEDKLLWWDCIARGVNSTANTCLYIWSTFGDGRPLPEDEVEEERKRIQKIREQTQRRIQIEINTARKLFEREIAARTKAEKEEQEWLDAIRLAADKKEQRKLQAARHAAEIKEKQRLFAAHLVATKKGQEQLPTARITPEKKKGEQLLVAMSDRRKQLMQLSGTEQGTENGNEGKSEGSIDELLKARTRLQTARKSVARLLKQTQAITREDRDADVEAVAKPDARIERHVGSYADMRAILAARAAAATAEMIALQGDKSRQLSAATLIGTIESMKQKEELMAKTVVPLEITGTHHHHSNDGDSRYSANEKNTSRNSSHRKTNRNNSVSDNSINNNGCNDSNTRNKSIKIHSRSSSNSRRSSIPALSLSPGSISPPLSDHSPIVEHQRSSSRINISFRHLLKKKKPLPSSSNIVAAAAAAAATTATTVITGEPKENDKAMSLHSSAQTKKRVGKLTQVQKKVRKLVQTKIKQKQERKQRIEKLIDGVRANKRDLNFNLVMGNENEMESSEEDEKSIDPSNGSEDVEPYKPSSVIPNYEKMAILQEELPAQKRRKRNSHDSSDNFMVDGMSTEAMEKEVTSMSTQLIFNDSIYRASTPSSSSTLSPPPSSVSLTPSMSPVLSNSYCKSSLTDQNQGVGAKYHSSSKSWIEAQRTLSSLSDVDVDKSFGHRHQGPSDECNVAQKQQEQSQQHEYSIDTHTAQTTACLKSESHQIQYRSSHTIILATAAAAATTKFKLVPTPNTSTSSRASDPNPSANLGATNSKSNQNLNPNNVSNRKPNPNSILNIDTNPGPSSNLYLQPQQQPIFTAEDVFKIWDVRQQVGDNWEYISERALGGKHSAQACRAFVMGE